MAKKVVVGMSGGVDSSVAALLVHKAVGKVGGGILYPPDDRTSHGLQHVPHTVDGYHHPAGQNQEEQQNIEQVRHAYAPEEQEMAPPLGAVQQGTPPHNGNGDTADQEEGDQPVQDGDTLRGHAE